MVINHNIAMNKTCIAHTAIIYVFSTFLFRFVNIVYTMLLHSTTKATQIATSTILKLSFSATCNYIDYVIITIIDKEVTALLFLLVHSLSFVIIAS